MRFAELTDRYTGNTRAVLVEIDAAGARREITHAALGELVATRTAELAAAGVRPGHVVGIRARNGVDWVAWDLAVTAAGAVLHAFPDETDLGDPAAFLTRHGLALLVTDDENALANGSVIAPDGSPPPGSALPHTPAGLVPNPDLHSLVHSSGTSGRLKGLMVSASGTEYVITRFIDSFGVDAADRHLIFLPLANFQQRLSVYCCLWTGADLVLTPYQRVFATLRAERPTFVIGPPVFYDTMLALVAKSGMSLVEFLGGAIRFLITGMAPIRRDTLTAFGDAGVRLLEAYGLTESGMIAWNTPQEHRPGTVGRLIDPNAVRFRQDGELLIDRPAPLSLGYFDTDVDTAGEVFLPDGSIATGDHGSLDDDGYLTLLGRKKDVIALGSGRKVHPAEIEATFAGVPGVADLVVVPTPATNRLGAIITPSAPADRELRAVIRRGVEDVNRTVEVFRRVSAVLFSDEPLRGNARFMTANMKLSRPAAAAYFADSVADSVSPGPAE